MAGYKYPQDWQRGYPHHGYYPYASWGPPAYHHHHGHPSHNTLHHRPQDSHHPHRSYNAHGPRPAYRQSYGPWGPDMPVMKNWHGNATGGSQQEYEAHVDTMLAHLSPAVQHSMNEVDHKGVEHAVQEGSLLGYLMGKGYSFHDAVDVIESGEVRGMFIR